MAANVRRGPYETTLGSPVITDDAFGSSVTRLLGSRIDRWLWAGGQKVSSSPLTMRDVARGDLIVGLGGGTLETDVGPAFNGHPRFSFPGGATTSGMSIPYHYMPESFSILMHVVWGTTTTAQYALGRSGNNPRLLVTPATGAAQWSQGATPVTVSFSDTSIAVGGKSLILLSYDAAATHGRVYVNSTTHKVESYALPAIDPEGYYTYVAGANAATNVKAEMSTFMVLNEPLHGDIEKDQRRADLLTLFATYYGVTLG